MTRYSRAHVPEAPTHASLLAARDAAATTAPELVGAGEAAAPAQVAEVVEVR